MSAGAAAVILLALAACTTTPDTPASALATASGGSSGHTGTLTGAGSTYVAPFFAVAFAKYHQQHPAVTVNYSRWAAARASPRSAPGRSISARDCHLNGVTPDK